MSQEDTTKNKSKRRLKAPVETVRQKQASTQDKAERYDARRRRGRATRLLTWPFRKIAGLGVWQTKAWKPFKFVGHWVGLAIWPPYFRNSFKELQMVTWPNWRESWRLTFAVLAFAAVFGVLIAALDFGLDKLFKEVLLK